MKKEVKLSWIENKGILVEIGREISHKFIVYKHDIEKECDWWDGKKACEDIFCRMPTSKELSIICENKEKINKLMVEHGGELLKEEWYWSSSEYGSNDAWYQYFSNGSVNHANKTYGSLDVRPVLAL